MVAVSVLVTRYTPAVPSVTTDKDATEEKTTKWLQSLCCRPGETEGQDDLITEVEYHQVQNEDSPTGTTQPDQETSFRVRVATFVLTLSITAFTVCLTRANSHLVREEAWIIFLCGIFGLMVVVSLMYIIRQPRNSATFPFMVPGVPFIPALTIFFNVLLLVMLNHWTYIRFSVWMVLGELTSARLFLFVPRISPQQGQKASAVPIVVVRYPRNRAGVNRASVWCKTTRL